LSGYDTYFKAFCDYLKCGECSELAKKVEKGQLSKEAFYEAVLKKHGTEKVEQAHKYAMSVVESMGKSKEKKEEVKEEKKEEKKAESSTQTKKETSKAEQGASCPVCTYTQDELEEAKKRQALKVKSNLPNICLACVAGMTLSIVKIMQDWYTKDDRKKLDELRKKIVDGEITVEDALVEMLKLPGAPEALDRILSDFNAVMEKAFERAANESEEFKKWMEEKQKAMEAA
jgi:hypothetical protein